MTQLARELPRRQSNANAIFDHFVAHANRWVTWRTLAHIGGALAWRTRVSDARKKARALGGEIQWNGTIEDSRYRYLVHKPIGPDAAVPRERKLF